jgi:hypothetical protein
VKRSAGILLIFALSIGTAFALSQDTSSRASAGSSPAKASTKSDYSAYEIAAAKASHKVWVNLGTGIYHKGGRWYGKTKNGKFMTEDEARKGGYKPAKRD